MNKKIKVQAKTIVAYQNGGHRILNDGCIVIDGNQIIFVGKEYNGIVDRELDCRDRIVTPGFISTHAHISVSPYDKTIREDVGNRNFYYSGLADIIPTLVMAADIGALEAAVNYSFCELIRSGITTVMEIGENGEMGNFCDYTADAAEKAGIRAYIAQGYQSYYSMTHDGKTVAYDPDESLGIKGLSSAIKFVERIDGRGNGRIKGYLSPMTDDTSTEELLRSSRKAADEMKVPLALHTAEWACAYQEIMRRYGMTPIEWLESIDFFSEWNILGHAMFTTGHSWLNVNGNDLKILADHGSSVAHCAWVFARYGILMESFPRYQDAGVNMCLGTDTAPQSMIDAFRWTAIAGKVTSRCNWHTTAADVFNAATLNPGKMLHRDDLGRIAVGAKADLLFWDADSMVPCRDVIKVIVYNSTPSDLKEVMIDGEWVMKDGRLLTIDEKVANNEVQRAAERIWSKHSQFDWARRSADQYSPQSVPAFEG